MPTQLRDNQLNSARLVALEGQTNAANGRLDAIEIADQALTTRVTALETDDQSDDARLTTVEATSGSNTTRVVTLETEVQAARGGMADLKSYIDTHGGSNDYRIISAVASGVDVIVTVGPGRASVNGTLLESNGNQTLQITAPAANITYHIVLPQTGILAATAAAVPTTSLYLGDVVIGSSVASLQIVDHRAFLTLGGGGGTADNTEVINARQGFATLDARLDDADARITTVTQEVTGARGGHESLDARLNGMSLSSGSISFVEDFATTNKVDLLRTDALVNTIGARVAKGTTYTDEFDTAAKVDAINSSTTIVVDTAAGEARMSRSVASATLATIPVTTTNSNYVSLVTQETHETILAAQPYVDNNISINTSRICSVLGPGGRVWTFDTSTNGSISLTVTDVNGNIIRARAAVMTCNPSTGTVAGSPRAMVVGTKIAVIVFTGGPGGTGNAYMRTLQADFSDIASVIKTSTLTAFSIPAGTASVDNWMDAKVDTNGRIWVISGANANGGNATVVRYAILEQDGTRYLDWTIGPIAALANAAQWSPSLQLLSTGEMAMTFTQSTIDNTRGGIYAYKCYIAIYSSLGVFQRGPVALVQGGYTAVADRMPSPTVVEVPTGTLQTFIQTPLGITRVAVNIASLAVTYRRATNLTEDVVPYGTETTGTLVPGGGGSGRYGIFIRPAQDIQIHDVAMLLRNGSAGAASLNLSIYRHDGPSWTLLYGGASPSIAASTTVVVWGKQAFTAVLEAGKEYFVGSSLSTTSGPCYADTTGGVVNLSWGQIETAFSGDGITFTSSAYRVPLTFVISKSVHDIVTRVSHDYQHLSSSYDQVTGKVSVIYSGSNGQISSAVTDYSNLTIAQFQTSDWSLYDRFAIESITTGNSIGWGFPYGSDQFATVFQRLASVKNLYARIDRLSTSISFQVTADSGVTWKAITPGGAAVLFGTGGTSLIMRATLTAPRVGATPHLLRYELQQWSTAVNAAAGRVYTLTNAPVTYLDAGAELTDGYLPNNGPSPYDAGWVGWNATNPVVVIDFGAAEILLNIRLFTASQTSGTIAFPTNVLVEASTDNTNWVQLNNQPFTLANTTAMTTAWMDVALAGQTYRYVRITATRAATWAFLGEVQVNVDRAGSAPAQTASLYSTVLPSRLPAARASVTADTVLNGGTITFSITNDGGVTWWPVTLGVPVVFDNWDGSDVRIKATLSSPAGLSLSPVLRRYTIITSDLVSASTVDRRLAAREIDHLKLALEVQVLSGAAKHKLSATVVDTFNDNTGIDGALSSGYTYDGAGKLVKASGGTATVVSTADLTAGEPIRVFLSVEEQPGSGSITYAVSRDNGTTWTAITNGSLIDISAQPSGSQVRVRAIITGNAQLLAWGWGWY